MKMQVSRVITLWTLFCMLSVVAVASEDDFQPRTILTVESYPARKVFGSLSMPLGSSWCDNRPMIWLVGHQGFNETPWCLMPTADQDDQGPVDYSNFDYANATFETPFNVLLDTNDALNVIDGPTKLDRHDCEAIDINHDGSLDLVCGVGANRGTGYGYNEVYLTDETASNRLVKVLEGHGLHKYPTMRNRHTKAVRGADGSELLFMATLGVRRVDGQINNHRMFRNVNSTRAEGATTANAKPSIGAFYFEEVKGPWKQYSDASCVLVTDLNGDGLDDIVMCNEDKRAFIFLQKPDSTWTTLPVNGPRAKFWRNARVADVTGDGVPDLIVVGWQMPFYVRVYKGQSDYPHFNVRKRPFYQRTLPYATPDIEILDVNRDGIPDIYIVQTDEETPGSYCAKGFKTGDWWGQGSQPPNTFLPPSDLAPDLLLIGAGSGSFVEKFMKHSEPGCGFSVEPFGNGHTMVLAQGTNGRPGHNLLVQW